MKPRGFTILEVVFAMAILGAAVLLFAKATSANLSTSVDNAERQRVALMASDLNNVLAARVSGMPIDSSRQAVISVSSNLINQLNAEFQDMANRRGYSCRNNNPVTNSGALNAVPESSTLLKVWLNTPPVCVQFVMLNSINTGFNGVWIETRVRWVGLKSQEDIAEEIRMPTLIAPM